MVGRKKMNYYCYDPIIRDIPEFPNYQISEYGEVYNKITGIELKETFSPNARRPYKKLNLQKDGKNFTPDLHRLLGKIFIYNPHNKQYVDHIDGNIWNNSLDNLRWVSDSENQWNRKCNEMTNIIKVNGVNVSYWRVNIQKLPRKFVKIFPYTPEGLEQAKNWRDAKRQELFGNFNRQTFN